MALYRIEPCSILSELEKDLGVKQSQNCASCMSWKIAPTTACPVFAGALYPAQWTEGEGNIYLNT